METKSKVQIMIKITTRKHFYINSSINIMEENIIIICWKCVEYSEKFSLDWRELLQLAWFSRYSDMITLSKVYWIFVCKWMMENLSQHEYKYKYMDMEYVWRCTWLYFYIKIWNKWPPTDIITLIVLFNAIVLLLNRLKLLVNLSYVP